MNVKLKGKQTPENWHIMATKQDWGYYVHWQHIKLSKPDKVEKITDSEFNEKYESL